MPEIVPALPFCPRPYTTGDRCPEAAWHRALGGTWRKRDAGNCSQGDKRACPEKPASMGIGDKKGCFVPVPAGICYPYVLSYPLNNSGKWGQNNGFVPEAHGYWLRRHSFCPLFCPLTPVLSPNGSTSGFRPGTDLSPFCPFGDKKHIISICTIPPKDSLTMCYPVPSEDGLTVCYLYGTIRIWAVWIYSSDMKEDV